MTLIAYRDGIMSADTGVWFGDACMPWAEKLARAPDGMTLYGVAGDAAQGHTFLRWVDEGCQGEPPKPDWEKDRSSFTAMFVSKHAPGLVNIYGARGIEQYEAPYFAIGAGSEGALCAMLLGATAAQAIEAALVHCSGVAGTVKSISFFGG